MKKNCKPFGNTVNYQDKDESYIGYNPTSVADTKANGLYSTDKNAKIHPAAFGVTLAWKLK
jgi:hypothetical protein